MSMVQDIQPVRGWIATEYCTNCINNTLPPKMGAQFRFWLDLFLTKAEDVESVQARPGVDNNKQFILFGYG